MQHAKPWHEDDFFWETVGPIMFTEQRYADAVTEVGEIVTLLGIKPGAHVLDLGCGVGRHSLEFARRGFQVTGVDSTQKYLQQASEQAHKEGLKVEFVQDDMRKFSRPETFDAAINMFTSFSYFEDPDEDRQIVANVCRSLKPGGAFLLHTHGKETLARIFQEKDWEEINGTFVLYERKPARNWGWMENRWIVFKDNRRTEFRVDHRLYAATELITLFTACGFAHADAFGYFSGIPYNEKARFLVVVGRK